MELAKAPSLSELLTCLGLHVSAKLEAWCHRDTFFRPLEYVRLGDDLKITCPHRSWKFKVFSIYVTRPGDELRTYPSPDAVLTLVTCYPFRYVGPAPQRLIVSARAVK